MNSGGVQRRQGNHYGAVQPRGTTMSEMIPLPIQLCEATPGEQVSIFVPTIGTAIPDDGFWVTGFRDLDGTWISREAGRCTPTHFLPALPNPHRVNQQLDAASAQHYSNVNLSLAGVETGDRTAQPIRSCPVGTGEWAGVRARAYAGPFVGRRMGVRDEGERQQVADGGAQHR